MIRKYVTLTRTKTSELLYLCQRCGLKANALVTAKASATTTAGPFDKPPDPGEMVAEQIREKSRQMIRLAPCPSCRQRDAIAVRVFRNKQIFVGVGISVLAALGGVLFSGANRAAVLVGALALALWYGFTQWDLWVRSPTRVLFDDIEPAPEPPQLPVARVASETAGSATKPPRVLDIEEPVAVEPTPFDEGPSVLK